MRAEPLDYRHRTTLFSLLCFAGDLTRAEHQLRALGQESEEAAQGATIYEQVLRANRTREAVLRGELPGQFMLSEPACAASQRQVIRCVASGDLAGAEEALRESARLWPACPVQCGELTGVLRDVDDRVAPFAELFVNGEYVWLPWEQLRSLRVPRPVQLRDLIWAPVVVELDAGPLQAFMPVLYPETGAAADELTRLGRVTVFRDNEFGLTLGQGARLLALQPASAEEPAPVHDLPLLEVDRITRMAGAGGGTDPGLQVIATGTYGADA
ncbi:MAG: type VI secretion system accessory protein TagJ [Polyangia bacterium]